jgi:hypothetical protein
MSSQCIPWGYAPMMTNFQTYLRCTRTTKQTNGLFVYLEESSSLKHPKDILKTSKGHFNKKLFRSAFVQEQVFFDEAYKTQARTKNAPLMDKKTQENGGS